MVAHQLAWWQKEIVYQVYPRSFQDADGDGVGDLPGLIDRLDYLATLGVGAVWVSPFYPSPMADFGYDVSDFTGVDPIFGTMEDFDRLAAEVHKRGLKLILDFIPCHTSDQHPWFLESRSSRDNPKRDWYIWKDPAPDGGPPNDWLSEFGGSAWEYDTYTEQYYLHIFAREQPDLNHRHRETFEAVLEAMRFWLRKGIDGYRVDVIGSLLKDEHFRDENLPPDWNISTTFTEMQNMRRYSRNLPEGHNLIREMRAMIDEFPDKVLIGEIYLDNERLMEYYGPHLDECHLPFNFQLIDTPWEAEAIRRTVDAYEAALPPGAWPNWVLGNHDRQRVATRIGVENAPAAVLLLLTLRGTPTVYYGEELGLENVPVPLEMVKDPPALNEPQKAHIVGRDPVRSPMPWDDSPNAGFTTETAQPWLPINADYETRNVAAMLADPGSVLNLFKAVAAIRRVEPALHQGAYQACEAGTDDVYAYLRQHPGADDFLIAVNFSDAARTVSIPMERAAEIAISTRMDRQGACDPAHLELRPHEALLIRLPA